MFTSESDRLVIQQAGVLERVNAGQDGVFDPFGSVRVGGNLASSHMSCLGRCFELLERVLRRAWGIATRKHSTGGHDFDYINAILDLGPHHVSNLIHAIRNAVIPFFRKHHHSSLR